MRDLLLPGTDAGVLVQVVLVAAITAAVLWRVRADPDARWLVAGVGLVVLGLLGVRALH